MRASSIAIAGLMLLAGAVEAEGTEPGALDRLKQTYLACDREATVRRLSAAEAASCSKAAEDLLQLGFGGDFDRMLAWWRGSRLRDVSSGSPP